MTKACIRRLHHSAGEKETSAQPKGLNSTAIELLSNDR